MNVTTVLWGIAGFGALSAWLGFWLWVWIAGPMLAAHRYATSSVARTSGDRRRAPRAARPLHA